MCQSKVIISSVAFSTYPSRTLSILFVDWYISKLSFGVGTCLFHVNKIQQQVLLSIRSLLDYQKVKKIAHVIYPHKKHMFVLVYDGTHASAEANSNNLPLCSHNFPLKYVYQNYQKILKSSPYQKQLVQLKQLDYNNLVSCEDYYRAMFLPLLS